MIGVKLRKRLLTRCSVGFSDLESCFSDLDHKIP